MPAMLAPILGPVVGGLILQNLHWSWIFLVNVPIGIDRLRRSAWRMLPAHRARARRARSTWSAWRCSSTGMPLIVYGLSELGTHSEPHRADRGLADRRRARAAGRLRAGTRCASSARCSTCASTPTASSRAASLTTFGLGAALFGAMILVPLYYQEVRHESVIVTGLLVGPQGLGMLLVMPLTGRLTQRFGGGRVALVGVSILCLGTIPLAFVGADTSIARISLVLLLRGVGIGLSFMPGHDRRLRLAAHRPALRRDPADERAAADRRRDRHRGAGGGAAARDAATRRRRPSSRAPSTPPTGGRSASPCCR